MSQSKDLAADLSAGSSGPDWEAIERDYRAGLISVRSIARANGISHTAIQNKADRENWQRDLQAKIKAAAAAKVAKRMVAKDVAVATALAEKEIVEANAEAIATVVMQHRQDAARGRRLAMSLMDELEEVSGNRELFENLGELMMRSDAASQDRLNELYRKVISMAGRTDTAKKLADTLKTMIGLEREAFNIDGARSPGQTLDDFLDAIADA